VDQRRRQLFRVTEHFYALLTAWTGAGGPVVACTSSLQRAAQRRRCVTTDREGQVRKWGSRMSAIDSGAAVWEEAVNGWPRPTKQPLTHLGNPILHRGSVFHCPSGRSLLIRSATARLRAALACFACFLAFYITSIRFPCNVGPE